jgi:hypothetical protein
MSIPLEDVDTSNLRNVDGFAACDDIYCPICKSRLDRQDLKGSGSSVFGSATPAFACTKR